MAAITIVDNEYITMHYLEDRNMLYHVVHQPISGPPLRDALRQGFDALAAYGATKWLSDDRNNGPMTPEDEQWNRENLSRALVGTNWKYWALIVPQQIIAAGSMTTTMEELFEAGLRMMAFSTPEEGFAWLAKLDD